MEIIDLNNLVIKKNEMVEDCDLPKNTKLALQVCKQIFRVRSFELGGKRAILDNMTFQVFSSLTQAQVFFLEYALKEKHFHTIQINHVFQNNEQTIIPAAGFFRDHLWFKKEIKETPNQKIVKQKLPNGTKFLFAEASLILQTRFPNTSASGYPNYSQTLKKVEESYMKENQFAEILLDENSSIQAFAHGSYLTKDTISPIFCWVRPDMRGKLKQSLHTQNSIDFMGMDYCSINNFSSLKTLKAVGYSLFGATFSKHL